MNSICLTGRLTANPERKMTQSGTVLASFGIAVKRPKVKDAVDFFNCTAWRYTAEYVCKYLQKGSAVAITGYLITNEFEGKDGQKRKTYEIVAEDVNAMQSIQPNATSAPAPEPTFQGPPYNTFSQFAEIPPDPDLPF